MTTQEIMSALNQEALSNPVFKDFALVTGTRERARHTLTVRAVWRQMIVNKFEHSPADIVKVFETLARLNLGTLKKDHKGRVVALTNITTKLPDIGAAAFGDKIDELKRFKPVRYFKSLGVQKPSAPKEKIVEGKKTLQTETGRASRSPKPWQTPNSKVIVTVILSGKAVNIPIPGDLTPMEIARLVEKLQREE